MMMEQWDEQTTIKSTTNSFLGSIKFKSVSIFNFKLNVHLLRFVVENLESRQYALETRPTQIYEGNQERSLLLKNVCISRHKSKYFIAPVARITIFYSHETNSIVCLSCLIGYAYQNPHGRYQNLRG